MMLRALTVILCLATPLSPVSAQNTPAKPPATENSEPAKPLDKLFEQLKNAKDATEAYSYTAQIERIWSHSGSDTADLLLNRASAAIGAGQQETALDIFDSLLTLKPDWAEGWNRRATLNYLRKDIDASMRDIAQVFAREPRHYGAWAGLGLIMLQVDNKKLALKAYQQALAINPQMESAKKAVEKLTGDLHGSDL